jgi:hypothetical protein
MRRLRYKSRPQKQPVKILHDIEKVTPVNLFVNYFEHPDPERQQEIDYCLQQNKANEYIDTVTLLDGRPSFNDFFDCMEENAINIIANSDIYFDETIKLVENIRKDQAYCLTRWELVEGKLKSFKTRNRGMKPMHSQDVWIFRGKPKKIPENIHLGIPGCDNKIAWHLQRQYRLKNPSSQIRAIHVHAERRRNYNPHNGVERYHPPYKFVMEQ